MPTHYKPTQVRGKRVVYQSTDPDEPRRETIKGVVLLTIVVLFILLIWILVQ